VRKLALDLVGGDYAVATAAASADTVTALFAAPGLVSVTRTDGELSVVCPAEHVPAGASRAETGWRLLTVRGPLEFTLTGIMAALSGTLAAAGVALFALSTYDTDHVLVRADDLDQAITALRAAGHEVHE
jgi:uncharacterized protein